MEDGESEYWHTYPISRDDNDQSIEYNFHSTRAHTPTPSWPAKAQSTDKGNEGVEDYPRISTPLSILMEVERVKSELGYHGMDHPFYSVPPPTPLLSPENMINEPEYDPRPYLYPALIAAQELGLVPPSADATTISGEARSTVETRISAPQRAGPPPDKARCSPRPRDHLILDYVPDFDQLYPRFSKYRGPEECDNVTSEHSKSMPVVAEDSDEAKELVRDYWNPSAHWRCLVTQGTAEDCAGRLTDPVPNDLEAENEEFFRQTLLNTSSTTDTAGNEPSPVGIRIELDLDDPTNYFYSRICPDISSEQRAEDLTYGIQSHFWTLRLVWYHSYNERAGQLAITWGKLVQTGYNSDTPEAITDEMRGLLKEIEDIKFNMKHETETWSVFAEDWKERILREMEKAEAAGCVGEPEVALIKELLKGINEEWEV